MKTLIAVLGLAVTTAFLSYNWQTADNKQAVNPIIGDISFVNTFGCLPNATTDEDLRIRTHLAYVEKLLRKKDASNRTAEQKEKRTHLLDLLHAYRIAGIFPRNHDYPGKRVPCFIDKDGRICAVGYLIEQTAGRQAAEQINKNCKYEKVLAMSDHFVDHWIRTSGLTKEECAMIQPAYGPPPDNSVYINTTDAILSGGLIGMNFGLSALNFSNTAKGIKKPGIPATSLLFGLGQIGLGSYELWNYSNNMSGGNDYTAMKKLGMTNIAFGTTATLIGTYTLITNKQRKNKTMAWNIFSFHAAGRQPGLGFCFTKQL